MDTFSYSNISSIIIVIIIIIIMFISHSAKIACKRVSHLPPSELVSVMAGSSERALTQDCRLMRFRSVASTS